MNSTASTSCDCNTLPHSTAPVTVNALKTQLAAAPELPLTVIWTDGEAIEPHFHITEIGRVQRDFVDCGGTLRRQVSCLLQTWVGPDVEHRLTAEKLLKAFKHAEPLLANDDHPVELEYEACNVVTLFLAEVRREEGRLVLQLGKKHTDCLAKDVCLPGSGCC